jgi:hypothetical protein
MGQAKQRGNYDERVTMARVRNAQLRTLANDDKALAGLILQHGEQRLATRLVAAGLIQPPRVQLIGSAERVASSAEEAVAP